MKKALLLGAAVCSLSMASITTPLFELPVFATETVNDSAIISQASALVEKVTKQYPNLDKWVVGYNVTAFEKQYGCVGMGCAADSLIRNNGENDVIAQALDAAGKDSSKMDCLERLAEAKKLPKYTSDAEFKQLIDSIETENHDTIFGYEGYEEYSIAAELKKSFGIEVNSNATPSEVVNLIKSLPGYDQYYPLYRDYSLLENDIQNYNNNEYPEEYRPTISDIQKEYDAVNTALANVEAYEASLSQETPAEAVQTKTELEKLVEDTKKNPAYIKAKALVEAVRHLEDLLARINDEDRGGIAVVVEPAQKADQPYVAHTMPARQANIVVAAEIDADLAKEIAEAIKAVGDAMRNLGIETNLGQNLTTANVADLESALTQAKKVEKFDAYVALVDAIADAEVAIANGVNDTTALKQATENLKTAASKVLPPNTGIAPTISSEAKSASQTVSLLANIATTAIAVSIVFVIKRQLDRQQALKK